MTVYLKSNQSFASRDLIDLAVLRLQSPIPDAAIAKAEAAYPVIEPLQRAIIHFQAKPDYRDRCYQMLSGVLRGSSLFFDRLKLFDHS